MSDREKQKLADQLYIEYSISTRCRTYRELNARKDAHTIMQIINYPNQYDSKDDQLERIYKLAESIYNTLS